MPRMSSADPCWGENPGCPYNVDTCADENPGCPYYPESPMRVVYATQEPPESFERSLFLVGPTPRSPEVPSWRPQMLEALRAAGYDGVVFVPEDASGQWKHSYQDQVEWEHRCLSMSDKIVAWVPRDLETMPALTTNVEFGMWLTSGKLLYGRPEGADKTRYLDHCYREETLREPLSSIQEMATAAANETNSGSLRRGGERNVPLFVWNTNTFLAWFESQQHAGNRLDDAKLLWNFRVGPTKGHLFCYTLWVKVWVESEKRHKENEFVFSRTDISCVVAYHRRSPNEAEVVLVREFRSPARTADGFIHELPGGSAFKPGLSPRALASQEMQEETGILIEADRFRKVGVRQLAGTLSTHTASVFSVELTEGERDAVLKTAFAGDYFGVEEDSERTYVEFRTLQDILYISRDVDWSMLGMILAALESK